MYLLAQTHMCCNFSTDLVIGIYLESHCTTHEGWCLFHQGISESFQNSQQGWRLRAQVLAVRLMHWPSGLSSGRAAADKLSHCSVSLLCQVQNWWTKNATHPFQKKKVLCYFFWSLKINIFLVAPLTWLYAYVVQQYTDGVDGWKWQTKWTGLSQSPFGMSRDS